MNLRKTLSREESRLLDDAVRDVYARFTSTSERADQFLVILRDFEASGERWASFVIQHCMEVGSASLLKTRAKALDRVYVSHEGKLLNKTASIGVERIREDGFTYSTQVLIYVMSKDELVKKREEYVTQIEAYDKNMVVIDRLIALIDSCPGAITATDAAELRGVTIAEWLAA